MDWERTIRQGRACLLRHLAVLSSLLGIVPGQAVAALSPLRYYAALALLRPAESALRRLIVIAERHWPLDAAAIRDAAAASPRGERGTLPPDRGRGRRAPEFRLFDPRKDFRPHVRRHPRFPPRITMIGVDEWTPYPAEPGRDPLAPRDAAALGRRVWAMDRALSDLQRQARRLAVWRNRRRSARAAGKAVRFIAPLRPGTPPGHRKHRREPIHLLLWELAALAREAEREACREC